MKLTPQLKEQIDNYFDNTSASEFMKSINKQKHITYHELKAQIYPYSVHFFTLDFSDKQAQKELKEKLNKLGCKFKVKKHLKQGRGWCIGILAASVVLIDTKPIQKDAMSVLSAIRHETHHAAKECLDYIGSEFGSDDEHFMYLCDWLFCKGVEVVFGDKFGVAVLPAFEPETEAETNTESKSTADIEPESELIADKENSVFDLIQYLNDSEDWGLLYETEAAHCFVSEKYENIGSVELFKMKEEHYFELETPDKDFKINHTYHRFSTESQFERCLSHFIEKYSAKKAIYDDAERFNLHKFLKSNSSWAYESTLAMNETACIFKKSDIKVTFNLIFENQTVEFSHSKTIKEYTGISSSEKFFEAYDDFLKSINDSLSK